ncbi:MAG: hypothetical protein O2816_17025, partial [Planctomycetota bacterium]|nr:hypothetical protein [Planctomycetota bacterium]
MISVPVLLLCAALTSRVVSARDASAQDIVTFEVDGETQRVLGAHVFSTNNENTRFQAVIYAAGARLAPGEANAQLRLGAERVAFTGSSAMPFEWTRYLAVLGAEQAQRVADGLELELQRRRDLGHALEG